MTYIVPINNEIKDCTDIWQITNDRVIEYINTNLFNMVYSKKNNLLTEDVLFILETLECNGHESRIVGGAVRNFLMGIRGCRQNRDFPQKRGGYCVENRSVLDVHEDLKGNSDNTSGENSSLPTAPNISDIDIATTATPSEIQNIFKKLNIATIPTGIRHGTITVIYKKKSYEITTLREDVKTFGRNAEVSFTKSFEIDSERRDFTMNAIYMDKNGKLFDYHEGFSDIQNKNVRFIGNPTNRIQEDYLRIFRYFRFSSYYGNFKLNKEYLSIIYSLKNGVHVLSIERIISELLLIFELKDAYKIISFMKPIIDELFDLEYDALSICHKINIGELNALDKFCMTLKFSKLSIGELFKKYCFPKKIKQRLFLECPQNNMEDIKQSLKTIRKDLRFFFVKYILVKMYIKKLIHQSDIYKTKEELISFCSSEYVDFGLKASDLTDFKLPKQKLEEIMFRTKKFWEKSNYVSQKDCFLYAINLIKKSEAPDGEK